MSAIVKLRKKYGISQYDMADMLKISQPAYFNKEHGKRKFTPEQMLKIFEFFKQREPLLNMQDLFF